MSKQKKNKKKVSLEGKFVVAWDTMVDGNQCQRDENNNPILYDSYDEAFKEIFDGALSMLQGRDEEELEEYNEDVTPALIAEMEKVFDSGDVKAMVTFLNEHPECNDNDEWVEKAEDFIEGRKLIFGSEGAKVTGKKLK